MKKILFAVLLAASLISFNSCSSGSNVGDVVCDYGTVLCDVSTSFCHDVPGVPNQVCDYLDLACYNLNQLCMLRDSTDSNKYQTALLNLQSITKNLREWHYANLKAKNK